MKRKICGVLFAIGFLFIVGVIGGVDRGEPLSNAWMIIPTALMMWVSAKQGNLFEYSEE